MYNVPDEKGHFGEFGGRYVSETLMKNLENLEKEYKKVIEDESFIEELKYYYREYIGRPNPLYYAERLSKYLGFKVYLKREDLNHTGAHKINNTIGQALLAKRLGKKRLIAETGAGQHGVATATVAALFDMECVVYMGAKDVERQKLNVFRMNLLGAKVRPVYAGTQTLKDAMNEALRDWVTYPEETFYVIGTVAGPHPYPEMVRFFQKIIGEEAKSQILEKENRLPDAIIACIGGGSNAMGIFYPFIEDKEVQLIGVEAAGEGIDTNKHAASINRGKIGVLHGNKTYLLQDEDGYILETHSISAGLDYPGVGPEHAYLHKIKRVEYSYCDDKTALEAFLLLTKLEGIMPALESSHALGWLLENKDRFNKDSIVIINLSGRGDKDVYTVAKYLGKEI